MFNFFRDKNKNIKITANLVADSSDELKDFQFVAASLGPNLEICRLFTSKIPERINGMFPQTKTEDKLTYKIIIDRYGSIKELILPDQSWNYHFVQPIDIDNVLVACARSHFLSKDNIELNAKIYDYSGSLVNEFLLGDGIQDLKVTNQNKIWTSYFDEGIFGNYGWDDPIGKSGLRSWENDGTPLYLHPTFEISDCYALNVVSDVEVWFYYYTDFNLARIKNNELSYITTELSGSDGFIIYEDFVLFRGGYDNRDEYTLYKIFRDKLKKLTTVTVVDEYNLKISANIVDCRGPIMLLQTGLKTYSINLKTLARQY